MLESFIVMLVMCIMLFGLLQLAIGVTGREVLHHAAARAARAAAVGFNDWMVLKAVRVASIPNSGEMLQPDSSVEDIAPVVPSWSTPGEAWDAAFSMEAGKTSRRGIMETARIPWYMSSENSARASYILNYAEWERNSFDVSRSSSLLGQGAVRVEVEQSFPLQMPFSRLLFPFAGEYDEDGFPRVRISGEAESGDYSALYLE